MPHQNKEIDYTAKKIVTPITGYKQFRDWEIIWSIFCIENSVSYFNNSHTNGNSNKRKVNIRGKFKILSHDRRKYFRDQNH